MTINRRQFLAGSGLGIAGLAGATLTGCSRGTATDPQAVAASTSPDVDIDQVVPFRGPHQAGIDTPPQRHAMFTAFDVQQREPAAVASLLADWTELADQLTVGTPVDDDTGETTGLGSNRLTITFGFGASLFDDACAPVGARPDGLVDLPDFVDDQLEDHWNGGDLLVQICADDPTVVTHAMRQLRRTGQGTVAVRWSQDGFLPQAPGSTPRNLFGQVDGTVNPAPGTDDFEDLVWVNDGPEWMVGGTYLATRRIRMMLTMWDRMGIDVHEATIGRRRDTGAPLTGGDEFTEPDLDATVDGVPVIAQDAHLRIARTTGPGMLRRGYSFDNGPRGTTSDVAVPGQMNHDDHATMDHSSMMAAMDDHDAGLLFAAYVRDPATQFIPMQEALSANDALGHFLVYTSAGLWAIPAGASDGVIGAGLFT